MTSDFSLLSAIRSLISPVRVLMADGTSLPVSSRGTLSTSSFSVPDISLVPRLKMNLFSATLVVVSFLTLILVLFRIVAHRPWLELALAAVTLQGFGS
jgi:hypothetical protein